MSDDSTYSWSPGTSLISQFAGTQFAGNRRCILGQTSHAGTLGQTYMLAHWGKLHIQCILLIITPENVSADQEFLIQTFLSISSHLYAFISCLYFPAVMYSASTALLCFSVQRCYVHGFYVQHFYSFDLGLRFAPDFFLEVYVFDLIKNEVFFIVVWRGRAAAHHFDHFDHF